VTAACVCNEDGPVDEGGAVVGEAVWLWSWLAERAPIEKVTGVAAYVSFGAAGLAIEAFAGKVGARESEGVKSCPRAGCGKSACPVRCRDSDARPVDQDTLYQMGRYVARERPRLDREESGR
jgi:hypothetical protein